MRRNLTQKVRLQPDLQMNPLENGYNRINSKQSKAN